MIVTLRDVFTCVERSNLFLDHFSLQFVTVSVEDNCKENGDGYHEEQKEDSLCNLSSLTIRQGQHDESCHVELESVQQEVPDESVVEYLLLQVFKSLFVLL